MEQRNMAEVEVLQRELEDARRFVAENMATTLPGRKCVDGRYEPGQNQLARPGGDMGYVFALLALSKEKNLEISPKRAFDKVYYALVGLGEKFDFHSDHHTEEKGEKREIGCGYINHAKKPEVAQKYGIPMEAAIELIPYARQRLSEGGAFRMANLEGEHQERGVLVIDDLDHTVNSQRDGKMYFVYDKKRDYAFIDVLAKRLGVDPADMRRHSDKQTDAILKILAKNKPIFNVTFAGWQAQVSSLGKVSE